MKKTISINIAGVVFHIEEDGYSKLKDYLASIHRYFSSYPDSSEILSDIEGRIAERFLIKQKNENKQAIAFEDVEELINAMGTVADFAANEQNVDYLEDDEDSFGYTGKAAEGHSTEAQQENAGQIPPRDSSAGGKTGSLYRDLKRKLIGGVASGLAHRYSVDPLWIRLIFIFLVIGFPTLGSAIHFDQLGSLSGITLIVYIAMWVAFPGSVALEDDQSIKKYYRNPDQKVIGGVASGLASYFGIDTGLTRLLFVLSVFFFGSGLIIYIILWIIAPSANTLTEKMEMQGQPITLSNIETNIKEGLNLKDDNGESNTLAQLLLLPFKAIALFIGFLGKLFKGLGPIVRIIVGLILTLTSAACILTLIFGASIGYGLKDVIPFGSVVPTLIVGELPGILLLSGLFFMIIPGVALLLLGLTLLANRTIVNSSIWLSLLGIWFISLLGAVIGGSSFSKNFIRTSESRTEEQFSVKKGVLKLDQRKTNSSFPYDYAFVSLKGYDGDSVLLNKVTSAKGRTIEDAMENATAFQYHVSLQKDSILTFDDRFNFNEGDWYRAQRMNMTLSIPYDYPFAMSSVFFFDKLANYHDWKHKNLKKYDIRHRDLNWDQLRWVVSRDSGLVCLNMSQKFLLPEKEVFENDNAGIGEDSNPDVWYSKGAFIRDVNAGNFDKIDVSDSFVVLIRRGDDFHVQIDGDEKDVNEVSAEVRDNKLHISMKNNFSLNTINRKKIGVEITVPDLREVIFTGAIQGRIDGFNNLSSLSLITTGACHTEISATVEQLTTEVAGASHLSLTGYTRNFKAEVSGASHLNAEKMMITEAEVNTSGTSHASLGKIENLKSKSTGVSQIESK